MTNQYGDCFAASAARNDEQQTMKRLKIIVADDESIIRLGLKTMLTELGHEPCLASNGREALNLARTIDADLALLDINMPHDRRPRSGQGDRQETSRCPSSS